MDQAALGMISRDGKRIAFNRIAPRYWRKGYKGNASADLYVMNAAGGGIIQLTNTKLEDFRAFRQDFMPMWGADGMIYFLSERDGFFNIWKIAPAARLSRSRSTRRTASSSRRSAPTGPRSSTSASSTSGR
jgi:Tol biopolymer transport system component